MPVESLELENFFLFTRTFIVGKKKLNIHSKSAKAV